MKKIFLILFVGVLGAWVYQQTQEMPVVNDVLLENVEALADVENSVPTFCWGDGDFTCPISTRKVFEVYQGYSLH